MTDMIISAIITSLGAIFSVIIGTLFLIKLQKKKKQNETTNLSRFVVSLKSTHY